LLVGSAAGFAKGAGGRVFLKTAGIAVLLLGIWNIGNGWNLTGITLADGTAAIGKPSQDKVAVAEIRGDKQYIATTQGSQGYSPARFRVKTGIPLIWTVTSTNAYVCSASIVIPSLGIARTLTEGPNTIEFTPTKAGLIKYSCSMGMFTGGIEVVN
jgi:plastocyanin